ncbi:uncharacterized protein LOC124132907 isoform X6 [Haliotis rufescens]|uniref:uncharacterized protein LOC124132907 isoform X6 n=1 Tax=Haliotis rufescens TaxID=6454 RepID=UPI00201EBBE8|nr:uncharacterized protein LOC124132907 isoform X6 [Haliotis rufescens]
MGEYRRRRETVFVLDVCEQRSISGHDDTRSTKPPNLTIRLTNNDQPEKFLGCCDLLEVKRVCQMACQDAIWKRALKRGDLHSVVWRFSLRTLDFRLLIRSKTGIYGSIWHCSNRSVHI